MHMNYRKSSKSMWQEAAWQRGWSERSMRKQQLCALIVKATERERRRETGGAIRTRPDRSYHVFRRTGRQSRCSSVGPGCRQRGPSCSRSMHRLPFKQNATLVFRLTKRQWGQQRCREWGCCLFKGVMGPVDVGWTRCFVGGSISTDTFAQADRKPGLLGNTLSPVPKDCPFAAPKCYYLTVCSLWEKVIIADCWKASCRVIPPSLDIQSYHLSAVKNKMRSAPSADRRGVLLSLNQPTALLPRFSVRFKCCL